MEDDFLIGENTEGVNEEIVKAIAAGKKKELDAMEAFGIGEVYWKSKSRGSRGCGFASGPGEGF